MKAVYWVFGAIYVLSACSVGPTFSHHNQLVRMESAKEYLCCLADTTGTAAQTDLGMGTSDSQEIPDTNVSTMLESKLMDENGATRNAKMGGALEVYLNNTTSSKATSYPVFEVKNSSLVILPISGKGLWGAIWADVLLDKNTMEIVSIVFDHETETPGLGAEITHSYFKNQFVGVRLDPTSRCFSLHQDGEEVLEGKECIDGVSGATITSKGAVQMLNNGLLKYYAYLGLK